ncbi:MAG TPA: hypothetical protein VFL86_28000, partial [Burkholderiaceae bacterium]|nr:hypothetical protein [Burkholderiaceae bacterium]
MTDTSPSALAGQGGRVGAFLVELMQFTQKGPGLWDFAANNFPNGAASVPSPTSVGEGWGEGHCGYFQMRTAQTL